VIDNQLELPAWQIEKEKTMVMIDEIELYNK
jgi:hypothetical protein